MDHIVTLYLATLLTLFFSLGHVLCNSYISYGGGEVVYMKCRWQCMYGYLIPYVKYAIMAEA